MKQSSCQKFIFKIHSSRLRKEKWNLTLPLEEARRNDEIISLADSQVLRWIDELNDLMNADEIAREIKLKIRRLKSEPNYIQNKREVRGLYEDLDKTQFKPDYMALIIDKDKDYYRACKGFTINGIKYQRLLGTNGGIKNSTIVFVSERLHDELAERIENGRDPNKELVTAKLEAYKALTCSASIPVSMPNGVLIVDDAETEFLTDYIYLTDEETEEPMMVNRYNELVTVDASDGFGIMLPSLAERWSEELELDYRVAGLNSRFAFTKGMIFTFDFLDFAEKVAHKYIVKDAWGNDVDIRNVELILTTSMVKLWDSYESSEDFFLKSEENGYTFGVTKVCPKKLESERSLNYQYIQSYDLSDEDIDELIAPTINEFKEVLGGDWRKVVLFLKGMDITEKNVEKLDNDFVKAIMIDRRILDDPFIQNNIYQLIKNRIDEAKIGVLKVHGNYSIVSGDPYLLCQSIFGLEKTGLLMAGEIYNKFWRDCDSDKLVCFRAPMTCHNNIRTVYPVKRDETDYWYQYMDTCTILNGWDLTCAALNGMDYDGDLVMLTDNNVLVNKHKETPVLMCAQRKAIKKVSTEEDFIKSNIESFGNEIGQTTNWITSMFEVRAGYPKESKEYKTLTYRIMSGQQIQQNAIDKAKGIVSKPMPHTWRDKHAVNKMEDGKTKEFYRSIVVDKKPYFMRYVYPALMKQYNTYIRNTNRNCLREFQLTVDELMSLQTSELTDRQLEFVKFYNLKMPVGTNDCIMNKICRRFEAEFDGYIKKKTTVPFNYKIMKSNVEYAPREYNSIKQLYDDYNKRVQSYSVFADYERIDSIETKTTLSILDSEFRKECIKICPNADALCNILLDICYTKKLTKKFVWSMCGNEIIRNLLRANNNVISFPTRSDDGDITYCGNTFKMTSIELEETK